MSRKWSLSLCGGLALLTMSLAGCSDPPNVGNLCTAPAQGCDEGLICETSVPGGYCTKVCTVQGSADGCPEGSVCDDLAGTESFVCSRTCKQQTDCRADLECNGTTGSAVKICKPKV